MKLTCLIVDDEPNAVALLDSYVGQVPFLECRQLCYDAYEALTYLRQHPVNLVFLDINMPGLSGMDLAAIIRSKANVIFTTAYSQYAVESYEKEAVDYLLKPISFQRFMQAVMKVTDKLEKSARIESPLQEGPASATDDFVFLKSGKQLIRVAYPSVLFFEGLKEYVKVVTATENILVYKRMKDLEAELPSVFQRIHHSYIINTAHISKIEDNHVQIGDRRIPMSEKYRAGFLARINQKLL